MKLSQHLCTAHSSHKLWSVYEYFAHVSTFINLMDRYVWCFHSDVIVFNRDMFSVQYFYHILVFIGSHDLSAEAEQTPGILNT